MDTDTDTDTNNTAIGVVSNRKLAVEALRFNPQGFTQCHLSLGTGGSKQRCALGVIAFALGIEIDVSYETLMSDDGPYGLLEKALGTSVSFIWRLNDLDNISYTEIADRLEIMWR